MSNIIISNTALENISRPTTGKERFVIRDRQIGGLLNLNWLDKL